MNWKHTTLALSVAISNPVVAKTAGQHDANGQFYVSLTGSDTNSCTNATAPCRTLERVRDKLRAAIAAPGGKDRDWTVYMRQGRYDLPAHIVFDTRDGVNDGHVVTWREYPGESVTWSGGREIKGWVVGADGRWRVTLPEVESGAWYFSDLWVNGQHSPWPIRPRPKIEDVFDMAFAVPSTGSSRQDTVKSVVWNLWDGDSHGSNRFGFHAGELSASWKNLTDVRIAANENFGFTTHYRLAAVDEVGKIATLQNHMFVDLQPPATVRKWHRENVFEDLSDPGEHYLDRATGELTYVPRPGESPATSTAIAGYLPRLVEIRNDRTPNLARNITFSGIHFSYTNDAYSNHGWIGVASNGAYLEGGAINVQAATNIRFERSTFAHLGQTAIRLGRAAKRNVVDGVVAYDLGGGLVSAGWESNCPVDIERHWPSYDPIVRCPIGTTDKDVGGNVIRNFVIHDFSKKRNGGPAIGIWRGSDNLVSHGEIYDGPTIGVWVGNTYTCNELGENGNNHVEHVHVHHLGYNGKWWSWDYAALYSIGPNEGSVWDHNYVHHIYGSNAVSNYEARGFYADNCSIGKTFTNNVVFMTDEASVVITNGSGIVIDNNILARPRKNYVRSGSQAGGSAPVLTFERNVIYVDSVEPTDWCSQSTLFCAAADATIAEDKGVYFRKQGPLTHATLHKTIADWRAIGSPLGPQSRNTSWNVDPLFIDVNDPRLGLAAASPAFTKGFRQIDLSTLGPIGPVGAP